MIKLRKSEERGKADHGWLRSRHTFSFAGYYDPAHMGFRDLRVINEDRIEGGTGFPMHSHRDMEIVSYVVEGALEHEDSHGNRSVIRPGEVQRMSAGTGVAHSEYNFHRDREGHFLQIWILPNRAGKPFGYGQKSFEKDLAEKKLVLALSPDGRDGSIDIAQDVLIYISRLKKKDFLDYELKAGRHAWIQVVKGLIDVNGVEAGAGDGLAISEERLLRISSSQDGEFLLFDLA